MNVEKIVKSTEQLREKSKKSTFLYILPDTENEFEKVFEMEEPESYETKCKWMDIIANAFAEYYKNHEFYDDLPQDIGPVELVLHAINVNNIPLVNYWDVSNVEKLSVRWLNRQI